ncbi:hypothetical protein K402DRAFT_394190 [Aulographum hederae CBS 113979]|uniref:Uncharacterized protein n=1 Tax=Aulographum hederae CBS 113979 TaxID=1176131 RepID=A0A6G1GYU3_9PEZI|nr:hypothetical protein K402DRAFT_394190 [Aulographum hederae CBS 113979]
MRSAETAAQGLEEHKKKNKELSKENRGLKATVVDLKAEIKSKDKEIARLRAGQASPASGLLAVPTELWVGTHTHPLCPYRHAHHSLAPMPLPPSPRKLFRLRPHWWRKVQR